MNGNVTSVAPCLPLTSEENLHYDRINAAFWRQKRGPKTRSFVEQLPWFIIFIVHSSAQTSGTLFDKKRLFHLTARAPSFAPIDYVKLQSARQKSVIQIEGMWAVNDGAAFTQDLDYQDFDACALNRNTNFLDWEMNGSKTSVAPCLPLTSEEHLHYDRIYAAFMWIAYYIPIAISSAGIIVNSTFLYFAIKGIYQRSLTSKIYLFLINKSIGDLLSSISFCIYLTLDVKNEIDKTAALLLVLVAGFSYWSASLTYLALSLVKFLAIKKPLVYRRKVTSKLIIKVLLASWPLAIFMATLNPNMYLLINQNLSCLQNMRGPSAIINASAYLILFLLVLITYATVLYSVHRKKSERRLTNLGICETSPRSRSTGSNSMPKSYRIMLAGFLVYSFCYFFAVTYYVIKLFWGSYLCEIAANIEVDCEGDQIRMLTIFRSRYVIVLAFILFDYFRSVIDPVITIVIDKNLRTVIKKDMAIFEKAAKFCFKWW